MKDFWKAGLFILLFAIFFVVNVVTTCVRFISFPLRRQQIERSKLLEQKAIDILKRFEYDPQSRNGHLTVHEIRSIIQAEPGYTQSFFRGGFSHKHMRNLFKNGNVHRRKSEVRLENMSGFYCEYKIRHDSNENVNERKTKG